MAGIKRFITYIYAYENGTKGINAGFAKVEIRGNECRIEVHLRGTPIRMGMDQVYLFKVEGGQMLAFPMGEMKRIYMYSLIVGGLLHPCCIKPERCLTT